MPDENASGTETQSTEGTSSGTETSENTELTGSENEGNKSSDLQFVKGDDGKEYIPKEAFEARLSKLTEQRNGARVEAYQTFMSQVRNDPEFRKKILAGIEGEAARTSSETVKQPSKIEKFLASMPNDQYRQHYTQLFDALGLSDIQKEIEMYKEELSRVKTWIGETSSQGFFEKNPDAKKYRQQMVDAIEENRVRSLQDAYDLVSLPDRLKGAGDKTAKDEAARKAGINKINVGAKSGQTVGVGGKSEGLRESIAKAMDDLGWPDK